jgi:hypothetical protein
MKFDTPLEVCPVCGEFVLLDQTERECAREHRCEQATCPLGAYFTGHEFKEGARTPGPGRAAKRGREPGE